VSAGATVRTVPLAIQRQRMPEWCWAAISVSVDLFFRPNSTHTQCELAGSVLNKPCCDGDSKHTAACNQTHTLHTVLGTLHLLAQDPLVRPQTPLTFQAVQKEIDAGRPICVLIKWLDNQGQLTARGHFIAIQGYRITPAQKQFVQIGDPLFGPSEIDFTQFSNSKGGYHDGKGVWFATFLVGNQAAS
jgi:Peptidase_C39 like family